jgi:muconolactone delta-isomerase
MRYLVEVSLKQTPTQEILNLLAEESAHGKQYDDAGIREALYVSAADVKAWQIYRADSKEDVASIVDSFPLSKFCTVVITELRDAG